MSVHGFGLGASVVGGFSDAHKSAIKAGFPDTIDTYGLVSGLWTSVFAFGAFVGEREFLINFFNLFLSGPTFGGILFDAVTFRWAIFLVIIAEFISLVMLVSYLCIEMCGSTGTPSPSTSGASDTDQVVWLFFSPRSSCWNWVQPGPKFTDNWRGLRDDKPDDWNSYEVILRYFEVILMRLYSGYTQRASAGVMLPPRWPGGWSNVFLNASDRTDWTIPVSYLAPDLTLFLKPYKLSMEQSVVKTLPKTTVMTQVDEPRRFPLRIPHRRAGRAWELKERRRAGTTHPVTRQRWWTLLIVE